MEGGKEVVEGGKEVVFEGESSSGFINSLTIIVDCRL